MFQIMFNPRNCRHANISARSHREAARKLMMEIYFVAILEFSEQNYNFRERKITFSAETMESLLLFPCLGGGGEETLLLH
jgi:hypothetical protein